jgi:hypothetical protein
MTTYIRTEYDEIKKDAALLYLSLCRDFGVAQNYCHQDVISLATTEWGYRLPVEILMLETATLMLLGGWYPEQAQYHLGVINKLLADPGLDVLLKDIPKTEVDDLLHEMRVMKLLPMEKN